MTEIPDCVSQATRDSETSPRYRRTTIQERPSHHGGNVMSDNISSQVAACSKSEDGPFLAQDVYGELVLNSCFKMTVVDSDDWTVCWSHILDLS